MHGRRVSPPARPIATPLSPSSFGPKHSHMHTCNMRNSDNRPRCGTALRAAAPDPGEGARPRRRSRVSPAAFARRVAAPRGAPPRSRPPPAGPPPRPRLPPPPSRPPRRRATRTRPRARRTCCAPSWLDGRAVGVGGGVGGAPPTHRAFAPPPPKKVLQAGSAKNLCGAAQMIRTDPDPANARYFGGGASHTRRYM